jgi:hypothetical protein
LAFLLSIILIFILGRTHEVLNESSHEVLNESFPPVEDVAAPAPGPSGLVNENFQTRSSSDFSDVKKFVHFILLI